MLYRRISETDLNCSAICLGTNRMGTEIGPDEAFTMLDTFVDSGGNFIDTANCYANWIVEAERSASEKTIGRWVKDRGLAGKVIIGTKGGHPEFYPPSGPRLSPQELWTDVEDSLRNLRLESIDIYWLHRDDPSRPVEEILSTLNDMVTAGHIRYFACSNWRTPRIREALRVANARGWRGFVADQPLWSLAVVDPEPIGNPTVVIMDDNLRQLHRETGMAAIPYASQANGLFSKLAAGALETTTSFRSGMYASPENEQRLLRVHELASQLGLTVSQVVLGYLMGQPFTTVPIVGCRNITQLLDSLTAGGVKLTDDQVNYLESGRHAPTYSTRDRA